MCFWIIRSRNFPLDIYMDFRDPSWDWDEASHVFDSKMMDGIMRFLVPHASRWRSVELLTDTWAPIFTFLSYTATIDSAPLLQSIRLARCNEYFVALGETFRPAHLALPIAWFRGGASLTELRHVSLSGVHVDWALSGLAGLRELELKYHARDVMPSLSEFGHVLRANPALERLVILGWGPRIDHALEYGSENGWGGDDELYTIELPHLEELEFGFVDAGYASDLLSLFVLPSLRELSIEDLAFGIQLCERHDSSRVFDRLVESEKGALERVASRIPLSRLRELTLRSIHADKGSIQSFLGRLGGLASLCLDRVEATPLLDICSTLDLCEKLRVLTLKDVDPAAAALVLSSGSFPTRLRVFLDIENDDTDLEGDEGGDLHWALP